MTEAHVFQRRKVWDLPTRCGHWLLLLLFCGSWWTAENGEMQWHRYMGYVMAGVLVFRVYWGVFGSTTARFKHFLRGPASTLAYTRELRRRARQPAPAGHNPLGALSSTVLLFLLLAQVCLGLLAVDVDGMEAGPLSFYVSFEAGRFAALWHERVFKLLLFFVAVHIIAVMLYWLLGGQNLIVRMISGRDDQPGSATELWFAPLWRSVLGVALAGILVWYLQSLDIPL